MQTTGKNAITHRLDTGLQYHTPTKGACCKDAQLMWYIIIKMNVTHHSEFERLKSLPMNVTVKINVVRNDLNRKPV